MIIFLGKYFIITYMKKFLFLVLIMFIFCTLNVARAEFMPAYTNSINHYGIGAAKITNLATIYEEPNLNSKVIQRIYWNDAGNFLTEDKKDKENFSNIFLAFAPNENMAFLSAEDETDDWIKVCYNQKKSLFGWIKKENGKHGAKFYPYKDLFFEYGKKYGIYTFRNLPPDYKSLHSSPNKDSQEVDNFDYAKYITPWLVQGNWMLVKVVTYDNKTKTGWFRWRSDEGRLYGFINIR